MKKKIILSSILALGVLGGVVGVARFAEPVNAATTETIYFKPNSNWRQANAKFDAWTWGGSSADAWIDFSDPDGDGTYEAKSAAGRTGIKIIRRGPSQTSHSWDNNQKWNDTGDLSISSGNNYWTQTESSSNWGGTGTWSVYTPAVPTVSFMGTLTDWDSGIEMNESNGVYTLNLNNKLAGEYKFKVKVNDNWLGYHDINVNGLSVANDLDDNCSFTTEEDGDYEFTYTLSSKTLDVSFTSYNPRYINELNTLITPYYNEGAYTRKTDINFNAVALEDIATHFHGSVVLERTTYFKPGELWMTRDENSTTYSYYGTSGENMTTGSATEVGIAPEKLGTVTKDHKDWDPNGKDENGMEGFYITLKDIMENISTAKWSYSDGVYSSKGLTEEFLAFTAPCLLDTQNYVQLAGVEIEEDTDGLHLRLLASGTNSGALTVDGVLSEATITVE